MGGWTPHPSRRSRRGALDESQRAPPDDIDQQPGVNAPLGGLVKADGDVKKQ
jgi:hypothetical protein